LKRSFWRSNFLLKYHQNPQVLKRWSRKKKRYWKKEKKRKKKERKRKRGRKSKATRVSSNKGEVNILRGEKQFNFKNPFWCDYIFSPSIIPFQKPFQNHWESFLTPFGPSFSLAIYVTWVVPFLFTHELHIFSL
jgi:hypothetical protein